MRHAGTTERFNQCFFDDAVFDVERQLAAALLRRAPANAVGKAGDIADLVCLYPASLFRDRRGAVVWTLGDGAHTFYFVGIVHCTFSFRTDFVLKITL